MIYSKNVSFAIYIMIETNTSIVGVEYIIKKIKKAIGKVEQELEEAQKYWKKYYDKYQKEVTFDTGEKVLLSSKHLMLPGSQKLDQHQLGTFIIQNHIGDIAY